MISHSPNIPKSHQLGCLWLFSPYSKHGRSGIEQGCFQLLSYSSNCQGCVWSHSHQHVLACAHHGTLLTGLLLDWVKFEQQMGWIEASSHTYARDTCRMSMNMWYVRTSLHRIYRYIYIFIYLSIYWVPVSNVCVDASTCLVWNGGYRLPRLA